MTAKAEKKQTHRGQFKPGQSGNPAGKKPGTRHKATIAAEKLLDGEAEALTRQCIEMALQGDSTAMRLVMERICPPRKSRPVDAGSIELPEVITAENILQAAATVIHAAWNGQLTIEEGDALVKMLDTQRKTLELSEIDARLAAIEQALEAK